MEIILWVLGSAIYLLIGISTVRMNQKIARVLGDRVFELDGFLFFPASTIMQALPPKFDRYSLWLNLSISLFWPIKIILWPIIFLMLGLTLLFVIFLLDSIQDLCDLFYSIRS